MWKKKTHKKTWGYARLLIRQKGSASKSNKTKSIRNLRFADGEGGLTTSFYKIN